MKENKKEIIEIGKQLLLNNKIVLKECRKGLDYDIDKVKWREDEN